MIGGLMPLAVMAVWRSIGQDGVIRGYSVDEITLYFLLLYLVRQLTSIWMIALLDQGIRTGSLSRILIYPVSPLCWHVAEHVGEMLVRSPVIILVFLCGVFYFEVQYFFTAYNFALFMISFVLAWYLIFNLYYCVGLIAFWTGRATAFDPVFWSLYTVFGGALIPLDLLPDYGLGVAKLLPFSSTLYFPVIVFIGQVDGLDLLFGFMAQLFWLVIFVGVRRVVWAAGMRRYSSDGG
jgi:ABC-2 type transport system permease protein